MQPSHNPDLWTHPSDIPIPEACLDDSTEVIVALELARIHNAEGNQVLAAYWLRDASAMAGAEGRIFFSVARIDSPGGHRMMAQARLHIGAREGGGICEFWSEWGIFQGLWGGVQPGRRPPG